MTALDLDDRTTLYILETRNAFEDLRHVVSQLSGLLVLSVSSAKPVEPHDALVARARETVGSAAHDVRRSRPTRRAHAHHAHLCRAASLIEMAVDAADRQRAARNDIDDEAVLRFLRRAFAELQQASSRLPGFPLVEFSHGCCLPGLAQRTEDGRQVGRDAFLG